MGKSSPSLEAHTALSVLDSSLHRAQDQHLAAPAHYISPELHGDTPELALLQTVSCPGSLFGWGFRTVNQVVWIASNSCTAPK